MIGGGCSWKPNRATGPRSGPQAHLAAQPDESRANLLNRGAFVLAEVGDGFVIRREPSGQPHHLYIAAGLALQPPARLDPVEIAVNVELEHRRRMVRRPVCRIEPFKADIAQIQRLNEHIDRTNRIALVDPIIEPFRQQRGLLTIRPWNETLRRFPRRFRRES